MTGRIGNVQIGCGDVPAYRPEAGALAELYGVLLDMERYEPGYIKLRRPDGALPEIGFENGDDVRPRWPDPAYPQQMHLDIAVDDLDAASTIARRFGAVPLADNGPAHRILADPVGHPFCLVPAAGGPPAAIARIVFDCADPQALAAFYAEVLGMPNRPVDMDDRVEITGGADQPALAFQRSASLPPKWPDPNRPAQLHLDLIFDEPRAALATMERRGAVRLRAMPLHAVFADPAGHPFCGPANGYVTVHDLDRLTSVSEFPPDWRPQPLSLTRPEIIDAVLDVAPDADFSEPGHGRLVRPGLALEFTIADDAPLKSFVIAFGTADRALVDPILRDILDRLGEGAFDADAPTGVFS